MPESRRDAARQVVNFGGNLRFTPRHQYAPRSEAEVLELLDRHATGKVRVVGALHSWSDAVVTQDVLIDLRHFNQVQVETPAAGDMWVTVGGGCRLRDLLRKLHAHPGLTLPSLGLITEQTIAGAISTGTHGSGKHSLSHYIEEVRAAAYDPATGGARIYVWSEGPELRAARCALGCMGIILSVRLRCVPRYDVAEIVHPCPTLDEVLAGEEEYPLQQFFLIPHRWSWYAQRRQAVAAAPKRTWLARLYRVYWFLGIDLALHVVIKSLAAGLRSPAAIRFFYRHILAKLIITHRRFVDRSDRMLVMEHELFRHLEIEIFVPAGELAPAAAFVQAVLKVFDGDTSIPEDVRAALTRIGLEEELLQAQGSYTHHYPIAVRRVLPDDTLMSMTAGNEVYYALSFITYVEPREPFFRLASFLARSMALLFRARLHWGKYFPLTRIEVDRMYPHAEEFRRLCRTVDPRGVFRNAYIERVLGDPRSL